MGLSWPLIRREIELDSITKSLTTRTNGCGVVLTGAPGVGKTTLARMAADSIAGDVRWVAGTESARGIPLGVFAHLVGASTSRDPVAFLSAARQALLESTSTGHTDLILGVDDAHLLDQLSATLLHQLVLDHAVHIVATVRSGETVPDAITALWKDGHVLRMELSPFTREQSIKLIESVLGGPLEGLSANMIWQASGGNALFVRHLVEGAVEAGTLRPSRGVWQLRGRATITSELASLLEDRIAQIPQEVLAALQFLTLCEPLDLDVLNALAGDEAVEEAERRDLITIVDHHQLNVRFTHPLFGEVVRRRVGRAAGRRLRGKLVEALSQRSIVGPTNRIRLAELTLDSDRPIDASLMASAAEDSIGMSDVQLGEKLARAALDETGGFEEADLLARSLLWQGGRAREGEEILKSFSPEDLDQRQLVRWGISRIANLFWAIGQTDDANRVLTILQDRVSHPSLVLCVNAIGCACAVFENRPRESALAAQAVLAEDHIPPGAVEWACFGGGLSLALMGRGYSVEELAARSAAVANHVDGLLRYPAALGEILALTLTGNFDTAERHAATYLRLASNGNYLAWGLANILVATVEIARGRYINAAGRLEQAIAALNVGDSADASSWSFPAYVSLSHAYAALGRTHEAQGIIDQAIARTGPQVAVFAPQLQMSRAWLAAAKGETSAAVELARSAARSAAAAGQLAIEAASLHLATRFNDQTTGPRLTELAAQCDGPVVSLASLQGCALARGDGGELHRSAKELEAIGAIPDAADAYAQAAIAYMASGDRRRSLEASAAASTLVTKCDHMSSPALREAAHPLPLTSREREVASMVAAGLSNREISERLFLSVRTVEGHIYHACIKLNACDRSALSEMMRTTTK
ncbi:helix-turn-helix transcriptional regulator [Rhodococcus opacus]|uniref:helix-turn-helix transcriptional regulator n=1 Tax=Rhodococcus opacus TaxID=37919 RepID=UPI0010D548AD|nr:LuxR family transcriptional regulator [Rhodococcus opacus]MDV7088621.1 LuxR C-terminal-related transcriptional regulator [Rhodococcus opacus]RYE42324.1 MAG: LuxR family transcriptional regulator [Hyphomicrobiales bacterium]